jgi:hypothetical protein
MNNSYDSLRKFFEEVSKITFWQRIFKWNNIKTLSYKAFSEFESLISIPKELEEEKHSLELIKKDNENLKTLYEKDHNELEGLRKNNEQITKENTIFKQTEEGRSKDYEKKVNEINTINNRLEADRQKVQKDREEELNNHFELLKQTWAKHEEETENTIREICRKHTIEYIDKEQVPFKGKPDNTIKICDEYIIFDAKSPASDDLKNFPNYIKLQTESVKKYIKEENIKKDIFLVIPSNTVQEIKQFTYNMADYNVYIVTTDALEPIILSLKKIEDYEFTEQLSPEERDNICRVIGKFVHITKRKMQIDYFFTNEFLSIIKRSEIDLPEDILKKVSEFETSEKLNPPTEKRAKHILTSDLEKDFDKITKKSEGVIHTTNTPIEPSLLEVEKPKIEE